MKIADKVFSPETKLFVFDMDGVIVDSEPMHLRSKQELLAKLNMKTDRDLFSFIGKPTEDFWRQMLVDNNRSGNVEEIIEMQDAMIVGYIKEQGLKPISGILEIIELCKAKNIKTAVASSSNRSLVYGVLEYFDLVKHMEVIVTGNDVSNKKPNPEIYLKAIEQCHCSPQESVALEDSKSGVTAAKAAGMLTIGYRNENSGNQDLSLADYIVDDILEITRF